MGLINRTASLAIAGALVITTAGCNRENTGPARNTSSPGTELGIVPASMDTSVQPGDDFFDYANGTWVKNTPIPEDRSNIGGFYIADQERERQTRELLDAILKSNPAAGSNETQTPNYHPPHTHTHAL